MGYRVNSKATLKIPLDTLLPVIPRVVHSQLLSSRYVALRSNTLVIQSEESRKQASNVETCFEKLYQLLRSSAEEVIPGETSQDQRERVHRLYVYFQLCVSFAMDGMVKEAELVTEKRQKMSPGSSPRKCSAIKRAAVEVVKTTTEIRKTFFGIWMRF